MKLQGNKVYLRPMTVEDTDDIVRWRNKDYVRNNFIYRGEFTREIHLNWIKTKVETGEVVQFMIIRSEDNKSVGSVYLRDIDRENGEAEYGIFIGEEDSLAIGYGTEACRLIVDYSFEQLDLNKLYLRLYRDNIAAYKSYINAGFVQIEDKTDIKNDREVIFMEINKSL